MSQGDRVVLFVILFLQLFQIINSRGWFEDIHSHIESLEEKDMWGKDG